MSAPNPSEGREGPVRVLFLCTGNSCRSQMAEAMLRKLGGKRFESFSAGSHPGGFIHPLAIEIMRRMHISLEGQFSKQWEEFTDSQFDVVITLCDQAAAEECPVWPGAPLSVHWPLPDPVFHAGSEFDRVEFAVRVGERLLAKVHGLVELDWTQPRPEIRRQLDYLGQI
jgi:arsenate reductase